MSRWKILLLFLLTAISCKKPYAPKILSGNSNYLVVEGEINSGADSTFIKLSRTVNLASKISSKPEPGAVVTVEGDNNTSYPLTEIKNGYYATAGLNLDDSHKYRLDIKTSDGKQYASDFVEVLNSPPIDSVSYDTNGSLQGGPGLNVYVTTHDPANKVKYYRWEYQETWIFHSNYPSYFYSNGDTVLGRNMITDNITDCWGNDTSSTIVLGTSAKLSQNVILKNPITSVASTSEKVGDKYSILVKQYALTANAYDFYTNLKKNTEQLGSIFDALPSANNGNIHCVTDPSLPVIGYISVGNTTSQRIFVSTLQLPDWTTIPYYTNCKLEFNWSSTPKDICCLYDAGGTNQVDEYVNYNIGHYPTPFIPLDAIVIHPGSPPIGYTATTRPCADCTLRGTNKKPIFWK